MEEKSETSKLDTASLKAGSNITTKGIASALSYAISFGSCLTSIGAYATATAVTGGLAALPAAAYPILACSSFVATFTSIILESSDSELAQSVAQDLKVYDEFINAANCFNLDIFSCSQLLLNKISEDDKKLQELAEAQQEILEEQLQLSIDLVVLGDLNFGTVKLDDTKTEVLDIFNRGTESVTITGLEINSDVEQFKINTPFPFTLGGVGSDTFSKEVSITFAPKDAAGSFNTFLKISNDKYDPFDAKVITAIATNEDGAKIKFSGSLNYNGVAMNQPHSEFFDIENPNLNENLVVNAIRYEGLPSDRFSINGWSKGTIAPGKKQEVEVVFEPTDDKEYSGFVVVDNTLDDINNKWPVFGKGKNLEIRLSGDLDFGKVAIGETETLTVDIENPNLNAPITVTDIEVLEGFSVDWNAGSIPPFGKKTVNVTFAPTEEKEYTSSLIVVNDVDQENNRITLKGNSENYLSGVWKLQLVDSSSDQVIMNELITFNTEENKINLELEDGGTYIENSYHYKNGLNINLIVENNISDACSDDDGSAPVQSTQRLSLDIHTTRVLFLPDVRLGEYSMVIKMTPNVPCIIDYPSSTGKASLIRQ